MYHRCPIAFRWIYFIDPIRKKKHASILTIDFEKAFDRIGLHVIVKKLIEWKTGPKIIKYITSFLTNRSFRIKINDTYSTVHKLKNGIPQGSPLSVALFLIAFNEISKIIDRHNKISHLLYADDLILFSKCKDLNMVGNSFSEIVEDLSNWGKCSGSKISLQKCEILHICKKI